MIREDTIEQEAFGLGSQQGAGFQQEAVKGTPACGHSLSKGPTHAQRACSDPLSRRALQDQLWGQIYGGC